MLQDSDRKLVLVLQYLLNKGDLYRQKAQSAKEKLKRSKYLTSGQIYDYLLDLHNDELFDIIQSEISQLINDF